MTSSTNEMTNEQFLIEIQSIQKDIAKLSSAFLQESSTSSLKEYISTMKQTHTKLKSLQKHSKQCQTRMLVIKAYSKKFKKVKKDFCWICNGVDGKEYTVQHEQDLNIKGIPSIVTSWSEDTNEEEMKSCENLLGNEMSEDDDYACFNICHIS